MNMLSVSEFAMHSPEHNSSLVEVVELSKRFGATQALKGVSIGFLKGEVHCLLGENGAGKSTIGKIISGLYPPDEGQVRFMNREVQINSIKDSQALGIAVVFQELSVLADLTVRENICLGSEGRVWRQPASTETGLVASLLAELDLNVDLDVRTGDLPIASQQLIEIAKALIKSPRLIILDEPTAMLNANEKSKLYQVIHRLKQQGIGIIFVTHHLEEVMQLADRVSIMRNGQLIDSLLISQVNDQAHLSELIAGRQLKGAATRTARVFSQAPVLTVKGVRGAPAEGIAVRRGEIVGLYGVVGCGRELIMDAVVGLAPKSGLELHLNGSSYAPTTPAKAAQQGIAFLPTGRAANCVFGAMSIRENLSIQHLYKVSRLGWINLKRERQEVEARVSEVRTRLATPEQPLTDLSGGNQQKVLLARCLTYSSSLLVLEDPTAGIDIGAKEEIHNLLRKLTDEGLSILLISSDLPETLQLSDVIHTMYQGAIIGTYEQPESEETPAILRDVLGGAVHRNEDNHHGDD
ncbi:TPA: sugar ABC transporter ATP-binding protein [Pseudomonas aeruginosa]|nr:sugar ABC transporter ATP-binding protein [Pseudomonas aeruginosa]